MEWIVEHLQSLWGAPIPWQQDERTQPHEDVQLRLDCSKALMRLGWRAHLDVGTALEWVVEWFRPYRAGDDMREVTRRQIDRFMELEALEPGVG